jgi:ubiquinone/menaquinone biosynthesis C-methylase UbiE
VREVAREPRVIEIGIGTGRIAVPLAERGIRMTGIDISPAMVAILREKRRDIDVMFAEASHPPLRDGAFDAALFVHILHLVPDRDRTLQAALRLLRPGAVMLLSGDYFVPAPFHEQLEAIMHTAVLEGAGVQMPKFASRQDGIETSFRTAVESAGGSTLDVEFARYTATNSARREYERMAASNYSQSWLIPPERLPEVLRLYRPPLEAFFGDFDREVAYERAVSVTIGRLP